MQRRTAFALGSRHIAPGSRETVDLPVSVLSDHTPITMSVHVIHGRRPGPTMFVTAAIHGDEVIGVEIVRRLLRTPALDRMRGTLIAVPIVNAFGFLNRSRYLPDRRDLNRSFPGSPKGSLASRLADLLMNEVICKSDVGIDLHSAAVHRVNLPQIRISADNAEQLALAEAFGAPLILTARMREGALRQAVSDKGINVLLYEAGEGLRFDELAIRNGVSGILRVMRQLEMIRRKGIGKPRTPSIISERSYWLRAPAGGLLRTFKNVGEQVAAGDVLGVISDPFGEVETEILAAAPGLLFGRAVLPVVNEGDGLFHIARIGDAKSAEDTIGSLATQLGEDPLFDEDEII